MKKQNIELHLIFSAKSYKRRSYWDTKLDNVCFKYSFLNEGFQIGSEKFINTGLKVSKELRIIKPNIIISSGFNLSTLSACRFAKKQKIKILIHSGETIREDNDRKSNMMRNILRKYFYKNVDGYIVYGTKAKDYLISKGVKPDRINIAFNSVDTIKYKYLLDKAYKQNNNSKVNLLFVGQIEKRKGLQYALESFALLDDDTKNKVDFNIIGGGSYMQEILNIVKRLNLKNVIFHGAKKTEEIIPFYKNADIFVFPSIKEIFGLVVVEALVAGLPVIASDLAGGTVDAIEEGVNGFIIDPEDVNEFKDRLEVLIKDERLRIYMGNNSLKIVEDKFSIIESGEVIAKSLIAYIN